MPQNVTPVVSESENQIEIFPIDQTAINNSNNQNQIVPIIPSVSVIEHDETSSVVSSSSDISSSSVVSSSSFDHNNEISPRRTNDFKLRHLRPSANIKPTNSVSVSTNVTIGHVFNGPVLIQNSNTEGNNTYQLSKRSNQTDACQTEGKTVLNVVICRKLNYNRLQEQNK